MSLMFFCLILIMILILFFFYMSKIYIWEKETKSVFECGFTSYFLSRFSFSIHYFLIALTFLLLDLELSILLPFFSEWSENLKLMIFFMNFSLILTLGLLKEWKDGFMDWKL